MISDDAVKPLAWGMNAAAMLQQITAQNIANVNTPGYKRKIVTFSEALKDEIGGEGGNGEMAEEIGAPLPPSGPEADLGVEFSRENYGFQALWQGAKPHRTALFAASGEADIPVQATVKTDPGAMRIDGNGVVLEQEMAEMQKAVGMYNLLATRASGEFKVLTQIVQAR